MRKVGNLWTSDEIAIVERMYYNGSSDTDISRIVGRSVSAVSNLRRRMSFVRNEPSKFVPKPPIPQTPMKDTALSCREHLIDLMREYSSNSQTTLGEAKAEYRAANELDVPESYQYRTVMPVIEARSYMGSHFADVPR